VTRALRLTAASRLAHPCCASPPQRIRAACSGIGDSWSVIGEQRTEGKTRLKEELSRGRGDVFGADTTHRPSSGKTGSARFIGGVGKTLTELDW